MEVKQIKCGNLKNSQNNRLNNERINIWQSLYPLLKYSSLNCSTKGMVERNANKTFHVRPMILRSCVSFPFLSHRLKSQNT
ncbi:hypothetical protein T02_12905 [Trichinella nativa]|uniref:Uncharacterized protein n=1 Tax=Trichinella nativa TaxID=6335 RepID=A0A0V1KRE5_9BILA|nr:hypothetical protein T02_12905 [Trichinella nativa]